jgi:hypothetical protein
VRIFKLLALAALLHLAASPGLASSPLGAAHITGSVTGPDGVTVLAGISVRAYRQTGPLSWEVAGTVDTAAGGGYDIGGLPAGVYAVRFRDLKGAFVTEYYDDKPDLDRANRFDVAEGQTVANINASLAVAGKISGRITAGGDGIADVRASAWLYADGSWQDRGSGGVSANNGDYTIAGLPPGSFQVKFSDAYSPPRFLDEYYDNVTDINLARPVDVVAGQTTTGINASMGGYGKITGKVTALDGVTALGDITVDVYQYNSSAGAWEWVSFGGTDEAGAYEAPGLVTRDYRVEFSDPLAQYTGKFYNDKATLQTADNIHVELGAITAGIDASLAPAPVTLERALANDWNLISLPLQPADPAPATIFASISGSLQLVYAYDGCQPADPWKIYDPLRPPEANNLKAIGVQQGLWLETSAPITLTAVGAWPATTSVSLCTGWNLIGYPSATPRSVSSALSGISGKYDLVYAYEATDTADPWKVYNPSLPPYANDLTTMQPWLGYWIRMTEPGMLTIPGR